MNPLNQINLRTLGLTAIITAPAMLIEMSRHGFSPVANEDTDPVGAVLYGLFSLGWFCAMLGLHRLKAAGSGWLGRTLSFLPLITVPLALGQTFMDLLKVPTSNPFYSVTDLAWPLSMLLTFAVSVAAIFAKRLPGWQRFAPLLCGISIPGGALLTSLGLVLPLWSFGLHTAVGWLVLGAALFSLERRKPSMGHVRKASQA